MTAVSTKLERMLDYKEVFDKAEKEIDELVVSHFSTSQIP